MYVKFKYFLGRLLGAPVWLKFHWARPYAVRQKMYHFCCAMRCMSAAYAFIRGLVCVCVSVTFVSCVKTHKDIFEIFSPSDMHAHHSSFSVPNVMAIFRRETPLTGASNAGRVGRNRDSEPICPLLTLQQARCCKRGRRWTTATISQVVTLNIAGRILRVFDHQATRAIN